MTHRPIAGRLVIATHNPGKLAEMRDLLALYGVDAISAGELGLPEPKETGASFRANARIKAEAAATRIKICCDRCVPIQPTSRMLKASAPAIAPTVLAA